MVALPSWPYIIPIISQRLCIQIPLACKSRNLILQQMNFICVIIWTLKLFLFIYGMHRHINANIMSSMFPFIYGMHTHTHTHALRVAYISFYLWHAHSHSDECTDAHRTNLINFPKVVKPFSFPQAAYENFICLPIITNIWYALDFSIFTNALWNFMWGFYWTSLPTDTTRA